jgi:transcription initiation factor TFIIB
VFQNKDEYDDDGQPCCQNPDIVTNEDGIRVCRNCGLTFGQAFVESERRAYTNEEVQARRRTEPKWRSFGPRTVITGVNTDARGHQLEAKKQALFSRLSKIQGSLVSSLERNFWEAKPKLQQISNKMNIPQQIVETGWKIYSEVARQKLTMGRSIEGFVAASLYAAIRIHDFPRLLEEVVEIAMIPLRSVHRSLGLIVRMVFPVLKLKYQPVTVKSLVYRFGNELKLSMAIQTQAADYILISKKNGLKSMGKDPKGLAAAAIYMACKNGNEKRTQAQIADVARITEVTLRTRVKQIRSFL